MSIETTSSGNIDRHAKWSSLTTHMKHEKELNHSNKFLEGERSKQLRKYNKHIELINYKDFIYKEFEGYIVDHDKKALNHGRELYFSPENYLKKRKDNSQFWFMEKFSNFDTYHQLVDDAQGILKQDQIYSIMSHAMERYSRGFNKRNKCFKAFDTDIHVDEKGAPHVHMKVMPFIKPKKKNGKPSISFNMAFRKQYGSTYIRYTIKKFREQEDNAMIQAVNDQLEKEAPEFAKTHHYTLIRKTEQFENIVTGIDHDKYVKAQETIDKAQKRAKHAEDTAKRLEKSESDKFKQIKTFDKRKKELDDKETKLNARETKLDTRESDLNDRDISISNREKDVTERENAVYEREQKAASLQAQNEQKQKQLDAQQALLNQQITEVNTLKASLSELYKKAKNLFSRLSYKFLDWLNSRNEKTLYNDARQNFSLMENYAKNGGFDVNGDSSLRDSLKRQGKDENNDGIDDDKEMNFHNLP